MAILTTTVLSRAGVDLTGVASDAAGDEWANSGDDYVVIFNGGGAPVTVTLDIQKTVDGTAVTDPTVVVAAGARTMIGPFPPGIYNNPANGRAKVTYSGVTSLTTKVLSLPTA